ncbi:helix-turn-helix transcriptional regulator [Acidobacteriota bacterium]
MILLSRAEEITLISVFKLDGNAYGVTIRDQIYKDIGHYWSFGVIYKTLKKMNYKKYVRKIQGTPLSERGGRSRYFYEITSEGLSALKEIQILQSSLWKGILHPSFEKKVD